MTVQTLDTSALLAEYRLLGDARAREALVRSHMPLVRRVAHALARRGQGVTLPGIDAEDLCQVGAIGLMHAIDRFDVAAGANFEAYAAALVAGEIRHYLRDCAPLVKPPRELVELRGRVHRAAQEVRQREGREGTVAELAQIAELQVEKVTDVLAMDIAGPPVSLDQDDPEETECWLYQLIDNRYRSFQLAAEDRIMLAQGLSTLRSVSREVLEFAFYQDLTQIEIATRLGISQMQVSRRIKGALGELWKVLNSRLF